MSTFGKQPTDRPETETKHGKITGIKSSPEKGCRRVIMSEKSVGRKAFAVDIPNKEARGLERKKDYSVEAYEKSRESEYGGMGSRFTSGKMKTYCADEAPTPYCRNSKSQFKSFGSDDSGSSSRLKF